MGVLYEKYGAPFEYLETLLQMGMMPQGLRDTLKRSGEDKLWQLYLHHSMLTVSFNDWKAEIERKNKNSKALTDTEMRSIIDKAQDILKTFSI